ncbi:MAG: hypothetical protein JOZ08_09775 [Verrucomicrobia bacterium]|nr:hypothetical protein [Verrucomicrobiota bacterium]MBV8278937.1 hypothetical protein [Verrucomicrobiota bacterium]
MDTATVDEIDRIAYLGKLMGLIQLYLEFNLSVTDAMLAAESDLVTWKTLDPDFRPLWNRRRLERVDQLIAN